ncbi:MAG: hypothetical protein PHY09_13035 [Desulfuromonadaceae bacterium]|nr:hypothetical protein [Desulfuromonadaceae bacterium]
MLSLLGVKIIGSRFKRVRLNRSQVVISNRPRKARIDTVRPGR